MKHRCFHYGALGLIGAAHLALLLQTGSQVESIRPPELLPMQMLRLENAPSQAVVPTPTPTRKPAAPQPTVAQSSPRRAAATAVPRQLADNAAAASPLLPAAAANVQPNQSESPATVGDAAQAAPSAEPTLTPPTLARGYLNNPKPEYPPASLELGEEGTVLLRISVNSKGKATAVSIARSSGFPRLDNSARRAAAGWTFHPAMRGSEPVDYSYVTPIQFVLPNKNRALQS